VAGEEVRRGLQRQVTSYGDEGFSRFLRGVFINSAGYDAEDVDRPVVGIADLSSDFNPCHRLMPQLVEAVKRGVLQAGALPMVFPTISLGEGFLTPTAMLYRNLLAIGTEEMIRAQPMDAVVLLGGCDKTVPAQLMAAAVADVPVLLEVVGPMISGTWRGSRLGACTDCRGYWARYRAGELSDEEILEVQGELATTAGTCMVMGTASTMASVTEALGLMLPGGAAPPAPTGARLRHAVATGRRAAELARSPILPREILTPAAFENALHVLAAIGGSTNAIVHLLAVARRAGVDLTLADFDRVARQTRLLVDLKPSGTRYMQDFNDAGGVPVLMRALADRLDLDQVGVTGRPLREVLAAVEPPASWQDVIRPADQPIKEVETLAVLTGTLAPDGAVIKTSAASGHLLVHTGPALVFESPEDAAVRLADPDLDVTADHVLVLRNAGPVAAGMPEAGSLPIPKRLAADGVTDMVRVSDARMSGTSYGTVVLHCSPESAAGGPLALVRDGDVIRLDVPARRIDLVVPADELAGRQAASTAPAAPTRGWRQLYAAQVLQANLGADLAFMTGHDAARAAGMGLGEPPTT
jgi:dihydroxy-acid dehydratase